MTFRRTWTLGARTLAINYGNGIIDIADLTFSDSTGVPATIIHELGHNWDTEAENPTAKQFFDLSRWRKRLLVGWTYDDNAEFANDYGRTNPQEDFATALEVYFSRENPPSQWQAKWDYIDGFLDSLA